MHGTLLDEASMKALWSPGALANGTAVPYAMGFVPDTLLGRREVWHNGLVPGAGGYCYNAIFPDDDLAVIVLSNGRSFEGVPESMVSQVFAAYRASGADASTPSEDPAITARAKDFYRQVESGTIDHARLSDAFSALLTPDFVDQVRAQLAALGDPTGWTYLGSIPIERATVYRYRISLDGVDHVWAIALAPDGKIAGSRLR